MSDSESNLSAAERVAALLEKRNISAVVIGAIALAAHRYVRHTEDIDLGVDATVGQLRTLLSDLRSEGFEAVLHEPDADDPLGGLIDVSGPFGLVQIVSFANRFPAAIHDALDAEPARIRPGSALRLTPIPQLVALKLYAGGSQSKADIVELLRRNPDCDLEEIKQTCARYRLRGLEAVIEELNS
jgi:hypothetical protein